MSQREKIIAAYGSMIDEKVDPIYQKVVSGVELTQDDQAAIVQIEASGVQTVHNHFSEAVDIYFKHSSNRVNIYEQEAEKALAAAEFLWDKVMKEHEHSFTDVLEAFNGDFEGASSVFKELSRMRVMRIAVAVGFIATERGKMQGEENKQFGQILNKQFIQAKSMVCYAQVLAEMVKSAAAKEEIGLQQARDFALNEWQPMLAQYPEAVAVLDEAIDLTTPEEPQ